MSTNTPPTERSPLRKFLDWLNDTGSTPLPDFTPIVPPAFNGIPPSLPLLETETITRPSREHDPGLGGIVASARRLTDSDKKSRNEDAKGGAGKTAPWQEESWELLDLIGEQRFLAHTLAGRMSQASLYVGKINSDDAPGSKPDRADDDELQDLLNSIGGGIAGRSQLIHRAGVNLFVAGEVWLVGIPPRLVAGTPEYEVLHTKDGNLKQVIDRAAALRASEHDDVLSMEWRMLSVTEITLDQTGEATLRLEDGSTITTDPTDLYMIRIWRPHPRRAWEADSPTRASLPVLRELLGLTQHISAQVDSRLAGAGLLAVSSDADAALKRAAGIDENDPRSPLMEALSIAMQTAIKDRAAASALVPLAVTVPGKPSEAFHHMSFSTPLDKEARQLRDEAIRRLALGQDAPPELLLGSGGMNHWGAWLVREDVVTTHLEPPLALICDALTTQYLRPLMLQLGYGEDELEEYVVWYDVAHLISRPNMTQDAKDLHERGAISDEALRSKLGFDEDEAPEAEADLDPAVAIAFDMVRTAASLAQNPGLPTLVQQIRAVLEGTDAPPMPIPGAAPSSTAPSSSETGTPDTQNDPPPAGSPGSDSGPGSGSIQ